MKTVYISIASHYSEGMIVENFAHIKGDFDSFCVKLAVIDNIGSKKLEDFCKQYGYFYYHDGVRRGYGVNHNKLFELLKPKDNDIFLVSNPDIYIKNEELQGAVNSMIECGADLFNIKSYLNKSEKFIDFPDRYFPGILNFFISIATGKRLHYGKNEDVVEPEWMSGGFIFFKASSYRKLGGFDDDYFMYCEDIDICFRAKKLGMKLRYDNRYYNEHHSQMASRSLFSKNIFYHIDSAFKFVTKNKVLQPVRIAKS